MATRINDYPDLVSVDERDDPIAHKAWADWRRREFGCGYVPKIYTVPSQFPPTTQAGADAYAIMLRDIRNEIRWNDRRAAIPAHPRPWIVI